MLPSPYTPLWIASREMISTRCEELLSCWKVTKKTFSAEAIHDLRVASRRLREALILFAPCFPLKNFSRIQAETKQLTNLLGAVRNTDEALLFFTPLRPSIPAIAAPALDAWLRKLRIRRTKELSYLAGRLKKLNLVSRMNEMQIALDKPHLFLSSTDDPFMPVNAYFRIKLHERETRLQHLLPDSLCEQNIVALHRLRIAVKKFRYSFELSAPHRAEDGYKNLYAVVKKFQEILGKIHDLDVFRELILKQKFEAACSLYLTELIASHRRTLYAEYLTLNATHPVDKLGERARELL